MKQIIILFASLFSLIACSGSKQSLKEPNSSASSTSNEQSIAPVLDNSNLKAKNLKDSDKVTKYKNAHTYTSGSKEFIKEDNNSWFIVLDSYESMNELDRTIKEKNLGYQNAHVYSELFENAVEADFAFYNLVVSYQMDLTSGANSFNFLNLYLKDNTLYVYMSSFDISDFPDMAGDTGMSFVGVAFFIEKDIKYERIEFVVDKYLPATSR